MKRNLVVVRCGRRSLHRGWLGGDERSWDLVLCPFEPLEDGEESPAVVPGLKWSGLYLFLSAERAWRSYDYIFLPDDDLVMTGPDIDRFFALCHEFEAALAAPALSPSSYFYHPITLANPAFAWRRTSFVEIMMPCFSRRFLEAALPTFAFGQTGFGFGLDYLWPFMLGYRDVYVFDSVEVAHTRPVGAVRDRALATRGQMDERRIVAGFGVPRLRRTLAGCERDGRRHEDDSGLLPLRVLTGYEYVFESNPALLKPMAKQEFDSPLPADDPEALARIAAAARHVPIARTALSYRRPSIASSISAWSNSQDPAVDASGGNDGMLTGRFGFHTGLEANPWWQVDLGSIQAVGCVDVYNRLDLKERCVDMALFASPDGIAWTEVARKADGIPFGGIDGYPYSFVPAAPFAARFVRVELSGMSMLHLDQVEVFAEPPARRP